MRVTKPIAIYDARTGEEWKHTASATLGNGLVSVTVKNLTTGQVVTRGAKSWKLAMYDALIQCGCPRDSATKAAKQQPW